MKYRKHSVRKQLGNKVDLLDELGLQMEHFPCYINLLHEKNKFEPLLSEVDVVLFSIFLSGKGIHYIGDEKFEESGDAIGITYYGVGHQIFTEPEGMEVMNFYIDLHKIKIPELPIDLHPYLKTFLPYIKEEKHPLLQMVRIPMKNPDIFKNIIWNMYHELNNRRHGFKDAVIMYFKLFLIECCRQAKDFGINPITKTVHKKFELMEELRLHLIKNYNTTILLEDLTKKIPLDKSYMCRLFKEYTGKSIFSYLLEYRLQKAAWLLQSTSDKIVYIALQSGFADLAYFNRQFKKQKGLSPSAYRKKMLG